MEVAVSNRLLYHKTVDKHLVDFWVYISCGLDNYFDRNGMPLSPTPNGLLDSLECTTPIIWAPVGLSSKDKSMFHLGA